ncbi:MAG: DUF4249 domain-containing protein [Prevotellaceae bacterium]|jgi:hypothetical protein|nr:DUF4249 domain-containing protein [Prevotellaceae bacterium]
MKNILKTALIFAAATLISCEKIIEFNNDETKPVLVVNSFVQPDSTIIVEVSESHFFLANNAVKFIKNADVQLFVNGEMIEKLPFYEEYFFPEIIDENGDTLSNRFDSYRQNIYASTHKVQSGDKIKIQVSSPNFEKSVWGETVVPNPPQIIDVKAEFETINYESEIKFTVKFQDNENEQNYYRLVLGYYQCVTDTSEYINPKKYQYNLNYYLKTDDIVFNSNPDILPINEKFAKYYIFSDELINGKEHSLSFMPSYRNPEFSIKYYPENDKYFIYKTEYDYDYQAGLSYEYVYMIDIFVVKLQSISKEYYHFLKTMNASYSESMTGFFSEPTQVFSNINNGGIGIVGAFAENAALVRF